MELVDADAKVDICVIPKIPKAKCLQPLSRFAREPNSLCLYDLHQNTQPNKAHMQSREGCF